MKTLEIVVHCFAAEIPDFAAMLTAQLSSVILHPPANGFVTVTVCRAPIADDRLTISVIENFADMARWRKLPVVIRSQPFEKNLLFRRSIGRNYISRRTNADVVWYADADYLVGDGTLDAMLAVECQTLWHPKQVMIHASHEEGDRALASINPGRLLEFGHAALGRFQPHRVKMAIGGLQFVSGGHARAEGYLDGTRWVKPVDPAGGFRDTAEDRVYRGTFAKSESFEIPGLYRLRHSKSAFESAEDRLAQTAGK